MAGGLAASLGSKQNQGTAVSGLKNAESKVTGQVGGSDGEHVHSFGSGANNNGRTGKISTNVEDLGQKQFGSKGGHGHEFDLEAEAQSISGDSETRPVNLSVNYYIKIN